MAKLYTRKSDGTYVPYNPQSVTNIDVVQTTGDSVTAAISQDAVTKKFATKQDILTPGNGISIEGNVIGMTAITESESQPHTSLWLNPSEDEETDVTYNRSQIDAMVGAKQDTLQLTVKDNGNIVLSNIQGQSKEFMPATPSGDPMHYAYEAAGAEWNGTGADIVKTTPWADLADDDADKIVIHKAGYWYLNGLGDITNDEIRIIYKLTNNFYVTCNMAEILMNMSARTNFCNFMRKGAYESVSLYAAFLGSSIEVAAVSNQNSGTVFVKDFAYMARGANKVKHFIGIINVSSNKRTDGSFYGCSSLKTTKIHKLKQNIEFKQSPLLTSKSILYMINNEVATTNITIILHPDAYSRAMANADIVAALEAHPNVSLASA